MTKPGLSRAVPVTIITFMLTALFVYFIRSLQSMEPVYEPSVTLVLAPFLMAAAFIWGMGGFDPRMSEHAHPPEEHGDESHHAEEAPATPLNILTNQLWTVLTLCLLLIGAFFVLALLPTGLRLDITSDPAASTSAFATNMEFLTPLGVPINDSNIIVADKLTVFAGFIIFTMLTLLMVAGGLGLLFYVLNQRLTEVRETETAAPEPNAVIRTIGSIAGSIARGLRRGLPSFFQR